MARKNAPTPLAKRSPGRPKGETPPHPVIGFRLDPALVARLDRVVARRSAELAKLGATVTRTSLAALAIAELCERDEAQHGQG